MNDDMSLFPEEKMTDPRPPVTVTWNMHHGCTRVSEGCRHCYMFRRDEAVGKDPTKVRKTQNFNLPVRRLRAGEHKGMYKVPSGSHFYACFSSDFFHPDADEWRGELWDMMRERSDCTFFMITKRPERIMASLPKDWGNGWDHITIAVTCENQRTADRRLPLYLSLPVLHHSVMIEPMLGRVSLKRYFSEYTHTDPLTGTKRPLIENVSVGGESGPDARVCDYAWILEMHMQCVEYGVPFHFHQTGARLRKGNKIYEIPREHQHAQAHKALLDFDGTILS